MDATTCTIPTPEILQDIADTQAEIDIMRREAERLEQAPITLPSAKLDHMKASVKRSGIAEREEFIKKLQRILVDRASDQHHEGG